MKSFVMHIVRHARPLLSGIALVCVTAVAGCVGGGSEGNFTSGKGDGSGSTADAGVALGGDGNFALRLDASSPFDAAVGWAFDAGASASIDGAKAAGVDGADHGEAAAGPPAAECVASTTALAVRPAEVLLVQDRSTAMATTFTAGGTTRWEATIAAIADVLDASEGATAWGLMLFPKSTGDGACCQMPGDDDMPAVEVAPKAGAALAISATLAGTLPTGVGAPTARALIQSANALAASTSSTSKYLVLLSGGDPTCASDMVCSDAATLDYARTKDSVAHIASMQGIPVAVVAIGLPASGNSYQRSNTQQLFVDLATSGGMPNTGKGQPAYYRGDDPDQLRDALVTLQTKMKSCTFAIAEPVAWPDGATLKVDGAPVARDTAKQDGWAYGDSGTSVVLYGKPCESYRDSVTPPTVELTTYCPSSPVIN
jgi:hypothetical protein